MQLFIKLWILGDLGNHFGSQAVPLRCPNLHFFIKYALGAIKNCVSECLKKNIKNSLIFDAILFVFLKGKIMLKRCAVVKKKNKVLEVRKK